MTTPRNSSYVDFAALRLAQGPGLQAGGITESVLRAVTHTCSRDHR
ncbi:MAG: hypothetical protein R8F63_10135 [Acidimicrobiales bacterium]|nr:hypothetical protein [Acidimicrobiales bacterium]